MRLRHVGPWFRLLRAFRSDARGQIAIIFAFASFAIMLALASAVDLTRAYQAAEIVGSGGSGLPIRQSSEHFRQ